MTDPIKKLNRRIAAAREHAPAHAPDRLASIAETKLANVVQLAERAQLAALTPEQLAEDARRDGIQRRLRNLTASSPAIRPADVQRIVFGDLGDTPHLPAVRRWMATDTSVLILVGSVGCGKTVAACVALAELGGAFLPAGRLCRVASDFNESERRRITSARLLVLDDVGEESDPEKFHPELKLLLQERGAHDGRTILTSNLPVRHSDTRRETWETRYPDPKLWSRIAQSYTVASANGPDLRRHA